MNFFSRLFPQQKQLAQPLKVIQVQKDSLGKSGIEVYGGTISEDYLQALQGVEKAKVFDKMRRGDARVKMCLSAVKNPIRSAHWEFYAQDQDETAMKHAAFLNHVFMNDIGIDRKKKFTKLLTEALTCVEFGHVVFERVHKVVDSHPEFGSYVGLKQLGWRSPKTLQYWRFDKDGNLTGIEQQAYGDIDNFKTMDAKFLNIVSLEMEGDNYEGVSLLRPCYGAWHRKQTYLKLMAIGIEKNAIPTPKVKVPVGKEASDEFTNMIEVLEKLTSHQTNYVTYPDGWELDFFQAQFDPQKVQYAIDFENQEMTFAFLANFLLLGSAGTGSFALSNDLSVFFTNGIIHIADAIAEEFDEIGKELIQLNFGPQPKYPCLKHSGITDKVDANFANMLKTLADGKFITPDDNLEDELRSRMGIVAMREEDKGKRDKVISIPGLDPLDPENPEDPDPEDPENPEDPKEPEKEDLDKQDEEKKKDQELRDQQNSIRLAESKAQKEIDLAQQVVRAVIKDHLRKMARSLADKIISNYNELPEARKVDAVKDVEPSGQPKFKAEMRQALADIARGSIDGAKREIPKAKDKRFSAQDEGLQLDEFEGLPKSTRRFLLLQSQLLVQTTTMDLVKVTFMQFGDSVLSTESPSIIEDDILQASETLIEGASVAAAGGNVASRVVNEARTAFFFDDEVLEEVESFTFVNGDPVSEICQDLAGKTFRKDDFEARRLFPPLHHNCKSYIVPNLVGGKSNPEPTGLKTKFEPTLSEKR